MWEYVALTLLLIFVAYERKARGESGIPLLGYIFDSVSFNVREEIDGEDLSKSSDKKKSKKHKRHSRRNRSSSNNLLTIQGQFLVRLTEPKAGQGKKMVLSVRWNNRVHHLIINENDSFFYIEHFKFSSVSDLIGHYMRTGKPVTEKSGAVLLTPVLRQDWELKHEQLDLGKTLGEGAFGEVRMGTLTQGKKKIKVAIKIHKGTNLSKEMIKEMCKEARIMRRYEHPNIVRFYGLAMEKEPLMLVMELVDGGSLDKCRVKISDFGLSREISTSNAKYKLKNLKQRLPIRWLAPETLTSASYSQKSDVFSFGILLWEVFSDGADPYPNMTIAEVNVQVKQGYRMPPPDSMPNPIRNIMTQHCFPGEPSDRWSMMQIRKAIEDQFGTTSVKKLNPTSLSTLQSRIHGS
ncbi:SH2 motif and Tyrosine protein kinase domain containing protein [Aphelenchoides besseyi]|nr:SH2 motif and Tyrosine protein kinase domain containing protein [Aphelenchoides besseyi]